MKNFPRFSAGNTELTAAQINGLLDQLRRQSRFVTAPGSFDVRQTPDGWAIRWLASLGFWAALGEGDNSGRYAFQEVFPDAPDGVWRPVPDGRYGTLGSKPAVETTNDGSLTAETVVWCVLPAGGDEGAGAIFTRPPSHEQNAGIAFWAFLTGEGSGNYGYKEVFLDTDQQWRDAPNGRLANADEDDAAVEANGQTGVPDGSLVFMFSADTDKGVTLTPKPAFVYSTSGTGFYALLHNINRGGTYWLSLNGATGGTFQLSTRDADGQAFTSDPLPTTASALDIQTVLEAPDKSLLGTVSVTGEDGGPWTIAFHADQGHNSGMPTIATTDLTYDEEQDPFADVDLPSGVQIFTATGTHASFVRIVTLKPAAAFTFDVNGGGWEEAVRNTAGTWVPRIDGRYTGTWSITAGRFDRNILPRLRDKFKVLDTSGFRDGDIVWFEPEKVVTGSIGTIGPNPNFSANSDNLSGGEVRVVVDGQQALFSSTATGGTWRLTFHSHSTDLAYNADADAIETALRTLENADADTQTYDCAGGPLNEANVVVTYHSDSLSGLSSYRVYDRDGLPAVGGWARFINRESSLAATPVLWGDTQRIQLWHPDWEDAVRPTDGWFTLKYDTGDDAVETFAIPFDATWQQVQEVLELLPDIGAGNVACSGGPFPAAIEIWFQGDMAGVVAKDLSIGTNALIPKTVKADPSADPPVAGVAGVEAKVERPTGYTISVSGVSFGDDSITFTVGDQSVTVTPSTSTGASIATSLGTLSTVKRFRVLGRGPAGGPWRIYFSKELGWKAPPVVTCVGTNVGTRNVVTMTQEKLAGSAVPVTGSFRAALGPHYKIELVDSPGVGIIGLSWCGQSFSINVASTSATLPDLPDGFGGNLPVTYAWAGGPLVSAPLYLTIISFPAGLTHTLEPNGAAVASTPAATVTITAAGEVANDAVYARVTQTGKASGGTWTFGSAQGSLFGDITVFEEPTGTCPFNASAAEVAGLFAGVARTAFLNSGPTRVVNPYSGASATGGPLGTAPVLVRLPTTYGSTFTAHATGVDAYPFIGVGGAVGSVTWPPVPSIVVFGSNGYTQGLVGAPCYLATLVNNLTYSATPPVAVVTRLDTAPLAIDSSAATVEAAIRATPRGNSVRVEKVGTTFNFSAPHYLSDDQQTDQYDFGVFTHGVIAGTTPVSTNSIVTGLANGSTGAWAAEDSNRGVPAAVRLRGDDWAVSPPGSYWGRVLSIPHNDGFSSGIMKWVEEGPGGNLPRTGYAGTPPLEANLNFLQPGISVWVEPAHDNTSYFAEPPNGDCWATTAYVIPGNPNILLSVDTDTGWKTASHVGVDSSGNVVTLTQAPSSSVIGRDLGVGIWDYDKTFACLDIWEVPAMSGLVVTEESIYGGSETSNPAFNPGPPLTASVPGANERQSIVGTGVPEPSIPDTGGGLASYTLTWAGYGSITLSQSAPLARIVADIEALFGAGNVSVRIVTGTFPGGVVIDFRGALSRLPMPLGASSVPWRTVSRGRLGSTDQAAGNVGVALYPNPGMSVAAGYNHATNLAGSGGFGGPTYGFFCMNSRFFAFSAKAPTVSLFQSEPTYYSATLEKTDGVQTSPPTAFGYHRANTTRFYTSGNGDGFGTGVPFACDLGFGANVGDDLGMQSPSSYASAPIDGTQICGFNQFGHVDQTLSIINFWDGICTSFHTPRLGWPTVTFPTNDGRIVTTQQGYILSVA